MAETENIQFETPKNLEVSSLPENAGSTSSTTGVPIETIKKEQGQEVPGESQVTAQEHFTRSYGTILTPTSPFENPKTREAKKTTGTLSAI